MSSSTEEREKYRKLPRFAYIGLILIVMATLGIDPGAIENRMYDFPEATDATYLELHELNFTVGELIEAERFDVGGPLTGDYDTKQDWLNEMHHISDRLQQVMELYAQSAALYHDLEMTDAEYIDISRRVIDLIEEHYISILRAEPPDRWEVENGVFYDGMELVVEAANTIIECIEREDYRCSRANAYMSQAFEKFGSVNGLLEWELRFEFEVTG